MGDFTPLDMRRVREALRVYRQDADIQQSASRAFGLLMSRGVFVQRCKESDVLSDQLAAVIENTWSTWIHEMGNNLVAVGFAAIGFRIEPRTNREVRSLDPTELLTPVVINLNRVDVACRVDDFGQIQFCYKYCDKSNQHAGKKPEEVMSLRDIRTVVHRIPDVDAGEASTHGIEALLSAKLEAERLEELCKFAQLVRTHPPHFMTQLPEKPIGEDLHRRNAAAAAMIDPEAEPINDAENNLIQAPCQDGIEWASMYHDLQKNLAVSMKNGDSERAALAGDQAAWIERNIPVKQLKPGVRADTTITSDTLLADRRLAQDRISRAANAVFGMSTVWDRRRQGEKQREVASRIDPQSYQHDRVDLATLRHSMERGATAMLTTLVTVVLPELANAELDDETGIPNPELHVNSGNRHVSQRARNILRRKMAIQEAVLDYINKAKATVSLRRMIDPGELTSLMGHAPWMSRRARASLVAEAYGIQPCLLDEDREDTTTKQEPSDDTPI